MEEALDNGKCPGEANNHDMEITLTACEELSTSIKGPQYQVKPDWARAKTESSSHLNEEDSAHSFLSITNTGGISTWEKKGKEMS